MIEGTTKRKFETIEKGSDYSLPNYRVEDNLGIVLSGGHTKITFVRGSKIADENVTRKIGVLHETLLAMMIEDLKYKNGLVPSRESSLAITKLEEALLWLEERSRNRAANGTSGTYKK